ncbi:MAG: S8 family serine peptidase, partial [Candidatus Kapaibacteriota bacterium]
MNKGFLFLWISFFIFFLFACNHNPCEPVKPNNNENNYSHYIVILNEQSKETGTLNQNNAESFVVSFLAKNNISKAQITYIYTSVVLGFAGYLSEQQVTTLQSCEEVMLVEKDNLVGVEPVEIITQDKDNRPLVETEIVPWGITAVGGYLNSERNSRIGWVVDTGIELYHPDLNVDVSLSKTFVRVGIDSLTPNDFHGHGTHVAGIIAAKNNDIGVVGVAAGNKVAAVKVLSSSGWGWDSDIIAGLDYISKRGKPGDVVNMSLGEEISPSLDQAVVALGAKKFFVVIAAGNSRTNANTFSPARANGKNVITVSAHDVNDNLAYFSNYGNPPIDYCAPG